MFQEYLEIAKSPCVFLSGGVDSLVVLDMAKKLRPDIQAVTFAQDFTAEQWKGIERIIDFYDLELHTFPQKYSYLIPTPEGLSRVDEYGLNALEFSVVRDLVHGDRCLHDLSEKRIDFVPFTYDVVFVGTRKEDAEVISPMSGPVVKQHGITFVAPLWELSKSEVMELAKDLPAPVNTNELIACSRCHNGVRVYCPKENAMIDPVQWSPQHNLNFFKQQHEVH